MARGGNYSRDSDSPDVFGELVNRVMKDLSQIYDRVDSKFEISANLDSNDPPKVSLEKSEFTEYLRFEEEGDSTELSVAFDDFLNSLWQLYHRIDKFEPGANQSQSLGLLSTQRMVLDDWENLEELLSEYSQELDSGNNPRYSTDGGSSGDNGNDDDNDDDGNGPVQKFVDWIKDKINDLKDKLVAILASASLDSWELQGQLDGGLPGFTGNLRLTMNFSA